MTNNGRAIRHGLAPLLFALVGTLVVAGAQHRDGQRWWRHQSRQQQRDRRRRRATND